MANARRYAEGTDVSADKSRQELEALLDKHGATEFAIHRDSERTTIMYRMKDRMVKQVVTYPPRAAYLKDPKHYWKTRSDAQVQSMQDAEWRRLWRAQVLITKAKLEMIASGGSTFEREFLADMMLANGETVAEAVLPRIAESYETGRMPANLLLGSGS